MPDSESKTGGAWRGGAFMWPDGNRGPWLIVFKWQVVNGRAECVGMTIDSVPDQHDRAVDFMEEVLPEVGIPLRTSVLRSIPLAQLIAVDREDQAETVRGAGPDLATLAATYDAPVKMRKATEKRLRRVADIYRQAWQRGQHPNQAVAKRLEISPAAAAKLAARARAAGLLPPTSAGVPTGETTST